MNNALVSIKSQQLYDDTPDAIEMICGGSYAASAEGCTIVYSETDPEGGDILTTVTVEPGQLITVTREGVVQAQMIFEQGRKHRVYYDTIYGALTVGISAHKVLTRLDSQSADIEIEYSVEVEGAVASQNKLNLSIRNNGIVS